MTALLALVAIVLGVLAFSKVQALAREIKKLEARLSWLERQPGAPPLVAAEPRPAPFVAVAPPPPPEPVVPAEPIAPPAAWVATPELPATPPPAAPTPTTAPAAPPAPAAAPRPATGRGWEELLGGRVLVWLGAAAMALGVVFLVRQFAGHLWLKPEFRLALGTLLGVGLLSAGEWLRKKSQRVASGASAAGIGALFAVAYAATSLYRMVSPPVGFGFLALVAFAAVLLSLRQGLLVAVLGLVGGMATPALVASESPRPALLFGYLLLLQAAIFAVSRRSAWWPLALVNGLAGLVWVLIWVTGPYTAGDSLWLGLFLLASTATALLTARGRLASSDETTTAGEAGAWDWLISGGLVASLLTLTAVVVKAGFGALEWGFVFILAAAGLALAALAPRFRPLAFFSAAFVGALLAVWGSQGVGEELGLYFGVLLAALALFAAVPYVLHLRRPADSAFAVLSAATLVAIPLLAQVATAKIDLGVSRGLVVLVLAAAALAAALPLARRRSAGGSAAPLGAFAAAVTSLVSLAVPLELENQWWSVGWALEVPALAWLATRLNLPILGRLSLAVAAAVVARLTVNPYGWNYPIGSGALVNWLLYGYGLSVVALGGAAGIARARGSRRQGFVLEAGAVALGVAWIFRGIHQFFHRGQGGSVWFFEWAGIAALLTLLGFVLVLRGRERGRLETEGLGFATFGVGLLATLAAGANLFAHSVGEWPVVNGLLLTFAVPAALLGLLAWRDSGTSTARRLLRTLCGTGALGLTFLWLTLEVRRFFRGSLLVDGAASNAEGFAYSAAWVVLGTALLVFGLRRDHFMLRLGGLVVLALAVGKVFLFDVAGLGDLYRVLSFLGLGASLLGLGYLYQRFVRSSS